MAELLSPVQLCDPGKPGSLNPAAVGWSRRPLHRCNLSGSWPRKKRWNYWAFMTDTHLFSLTVSNIDYAGLAFIYLADFESGSVHEETVLTPFGRGCELPEHVYEDVRFESRKLRISIEQVDRQPVAVDESGLPGCPRTVSFCVEAASFGGQPLRAELEASYPFEHETLNVVVPWDDRRFQFTAKHNTLPAHGVVELAAAIAAAGREDVTCETLAVNANEDWLG
jgi:hypothetical protein